MTFAELVKRAASRARTGRNAERAYGTIHDRDALFVLEAAADLIGEAVMVRRERVIIPGLGTFRPVKRKEREVLNPKTKERMTLPEFWTIAFRSSKHRKKAVK